MKILVVGASGATGRLLVEQLLNTGHHVKIIVRSTENLPEHITSHKNLSVVKSSILSLSDTEMARHVSGFDAIASCLGHNLSFKGIFGSPRRLVADATRRLCCAITSNNPEGSVKFVLMNSTGCRNRDLNEKISFAQKCVILLLRLLLPPHADNESAVDYLRTQIGQDNEIIKWAAVRPDGLIDNDVVNEYDLYPSPIRSAIFDAGKTSRINVGHFMAELMTNDDVWDVWKGKMPVIYNHEL
ncbi:MAG: NAD-dependent epimerase [Zetaproteobacteria bacterium]|nr:MAG: NAD-dependent epimerase [Zetaproteobacteria bacterium]